MKTNRERILAAAVLTGITIAAPSMAEESLPSAIQCYSDSTNAKDIDAYMACFVEDAEMIDVSRTFSGQEAIRAWALREVIPNGNRFSHRGIIEMSDGYAKTDVKWMSWEVTYSYWWNSEGKITKMSLQY